MTILWMRNSALYHLSVTHVTKSVILRSELHVEHVVRGHSETAMSCTKKAISRDAVWVVDLGGANVRNMTEPSVFGDDAAFLSYYSNHLLLFEVVSIHCKSLHTLVMLCFCTTRSILYK